MRTSLSTLPIDFGGYRISELTSALQALGIGEPVFLGGPGRWRDSGMEGTPPRRWQRFIDADMREAVGELVAIIRQLRPHVVVTYGPKGGFGHPRPHPRTPHHHCGGCCIGLRRVSSGKPWRVPKLYWTVISTSAMAAGMSSLRDVPDGWTRVSIDDVPFGYPDDQIDAVVDASEQLPAKVAALRAHATQVTVAPNGRSCALSNNIALPILAEEHYLLAAGSPGDRDERRDGKPTCWLG